MTRLRAKANPDQLEILSDVQPLIAFLLEIKYPDERLRQSGADLLSHLSGAIERFLIVVINLYSDRDHLIVIILDDLHWIDDASSNVLENLLNTISRDYSLSRLFFIMMHRPDYSVPSS
jgi:predicted ATPase